MKFISKVAVLVLPLCSMHPLAWSQNLKKQEVASVAENIQGIQTGFLGLWYFNETKLLPSLSIRGEAGFDVGARGNNTYKIWAATAVISVEPRIYYNLKKRQRKEHSIEKNSGDYLSLKMWYHPDWFTFGTEKNIAAVRDFAIVPEWGMMRTFGHFTYELGLGIGGHCQFLKDYGYQNNQWEVTGELHVRLGYTF